MKSEALITTHTSADEKNMNISNGIQEETKVIIKNVLHMKFN